MGHSAYIVMAVQQRDTYPLNHQHNCWAIENHITCISKPSNIAITKWYCITLALLMRKHSEKWQLAECTLPVILTNETSCADQEYVLTILLKMWFLWFYCVLVPVTLWISIWDTSLVLGNVMIASLQMTYSNAFSWMKSFVFQLKICWSLFLRSNWQ